MFINILYSYKRKFEGIRMDEKMQAYNEVTILNNEGNITERDLKIFLRDLANNVKNVYNR